MSATLTHVSADALDSAIRRSQEFLLSLQHEEGYWNCELPIDSTVACDYLMYFYWTREEHAVPVARIAEFVRSRQLEDGGWPQFPGGPSELNASVKGYQALKMAGDSVNAPHMECARTKILELGGIPKMHTWGKLYLALTGCFPWEYCPLIPAELMLMPKWFPVHIYRMSSWTRNMLVPLAIINHFKPVRRIESCPDLNELYPGGSMDAGNWAQKFDSKIFTMKNVFLALDRVGRVVNHLPEGWFRRRALKLAEGWMCDRIGRGSDGMGAIFPAIENTLIALELLGYSKDHWIYRKNRQHFEELTMYDREQPIFLSNDRTNYYEKGKVVEPGWRVGPCFSPVWDTALITMALGESGISSEDQRMKKAGDWLLDREIGIRGDWRENCDFPEATGWAFEFNNEWYPDVDDTFQVLLGLKASGSNDPSRLSAALDRGIRWCRAMQCRDGGFAAFDKDVTDWWLEAIPFADHNAILDPACSDITGRALETLAMAGYTSDDEVVQRARDFLWNTQEEDGSWYGRWGINYIYGTGHAVRGLHAIGEDMSSPRLQRARNWLENHQNADGGWGESPWTYHDASTRGQGPSTASQTAWALLGLLCFGDPQRPSVKRGVDYLLRTQLEDGSWHYDEYTGTGFPRIFYLKYSSYQWHWPLYALAKYRKAVEAVQV